MTIEIYPSTLPGLPVETHECQGGTVGAWLDSKGLAWRGENSNRIVVSVNGREMPVADWDSTPVGDADLVQIRVCPAGGALGGIFDLIGGVLDFVFGWLIPGGDEAGTAGGRGAEVDSADAKANTAKLGSVVPELCGRYRRFPEYLTAPRRHFASPRSQVLEFLVCIGPGDYEILPGDVKVGDTPLDTLGDAVEYEIFPPGADLSANEAHEAWHTSSEVGATSGGTAGIELSAVPSSAVDPVADEYAFDGAQIDIVGGDWPESWGALTALTIRLPLGYTITLETDPITANTINRVAGNFLEVAPYVGMSLSVEGDAFPSDTYVVRDLSLNPQGDGWIELEDEFGQPVNDLDLGPSVATLFRDGRSYRVVSIAGAALTVEAIVGGVVEAGWAGFDPVVSSQAVIRADASTVYGEWAGPFVGCPAGAQSSVYETDVFFPNGLTYIEEGGELAGWSIRIEIQHRAVGSSGSWTSVLVQHSDATLDQIGFTERVAVPESRREFRVRRIGARSTSNQVRDVVQWYGLRVRMPTLTAYPNWTTMAVRLHGATKIGVRSENQINVVATRVLPTMLPDGSFGPPQATRDISAFVRYIAQPTGYSLDIDELLRLHELWCARGDYADNIFDETTVKGALDSVLQAGMSELTIDDAQIRPVRDEVRTQFEQSYSPQNMTGDMRRGFTAFKVGESDGVEVEFMDAETWTRDVVQCRLPGDVGAKVEKLKVDCVTDRTRAWRLGMRRRRSLAYRRWEYEFSTEWDALNSRYLSYVALVDDVPGYGQSALLVGISPHAVGAVLEVTEPLAWHAGEQHVVAYRSAEGDLVGPFPAQPGPTDFTVVAAIPAPWPVITLDQELPHVYFGPVATWTWPALVTAISPKGTGSVAVSAVGYDPRVYVDDDGFPA